jgi:hypothetical protein
VVVRLSVGIEGGYACFGMERKEGKRREGRRKRKRRMWVKGSVRDEEW